MKINHPAAHLMAVLPATYILCFTSLKMVQLV